MAMNDTDLTALRESVVWARSTHIAELRVRGEHAFELVDRVFTRELYVQDGQLRHGLFLNDEGSIFADVYVARDADDFLILAEGPTPQELLRYLERHRPPEATDVQLEQVSRSMVGLHGPYAWELLAEIVGPEVIGLPYLTFFQQQQQQQQQQGAITCYRAGQTGEYGYLLSTTDPAGLVETLVAKGAEFDGREVELQTLDLAAFESFFFCIRDQALASLDPVRLQLQWRIGGRGFVGAEALPQKPHERLAMARVEGDPGDATAVTMGEQTVGRLVTCRSTPSLGGHHATLLLRRDLSHPGLAVFKLGEATLTTVTPSPLRPRSLFVNPQRHTYAGRASQQFPAMTAAET